LRLTPLDLSFRALAAMGFFAFHAGPTNMAAPSAFRDQMHRV
jgi:hypothetical protein